MVQQDLTDQVAGDLVDHVPPGPGAEQVLVQSEGVDLPVLAVQPVAGQR